MKIDPLKKYKSESLKRVRSYKKNKSLQKSWQKFHQEIVKAKYAYNFFWLGLPVIQAPQDLYAMQELIWEVKPDLIIETGVAWGGSILFSASMLSILESCGKIKNGSVIGIEINIFPHNKKAISSHPLAKKITLLEGSSVDKKIVDQVKKIARGKKKVLVLLDSNHTHDHVLSELRLYSPFVSKGSYLIVEDTGVEDLPKGTIKGRSYGKGNNPKTAVWEFLKENKKFRIDKNIESKLILTSSPDGFLKRIR